jgi:two-component system, cell cycle sensor histidine kinase and response regulator CckA
MLRARGVDALEASDGQVGLELLRNHGPDIDLVLLDLTIDGTDPATLIAELRRTERDTPVVIMSGYSQSQTDRAVLADVAGYLQKPFRPQKLFDTITAAMSTPSVD